MFILRTLLVIVLLAPSVVLAQTNYRACFEENAILLFEEQNYQKAFEKLDHAFLVQSALGLNQIRKPTEEEMAVGKQVLFETLKGSPDKGHIVPESVVINSRYAGGSQIDGKLRIEGGGYPDEYTFIVRFTMRTCLVRDIIIGSLYSILSELKNNGKINKRALEIERSLAAK